MMTPAVVLALAAAVVFACMGAGVLAAPRLFRSELRFHLAGVGEVGPVTMLVTGVACLILSYHIVVHALGVMAHFRAPMWMAAAGAAVAVLASLGLDAMDNRRDADTPGDDNSRF